MSKECARVHEHHLRILVIDDSEPYLNFMRILLSEDYDVMTALSPQEAQQSAALSQADLLITDALFPGLEPFAVLDVLRQQPACRTIPILLCTGAVHEAKAAGERLQQERLKVLFKPFDIDALAACIMELTGTPRERL
jgi:response regulator RpfG family c-di-GMP phosphodiesterase